MPLPPLNIFEKMRGIYTPVTDIRRKVLTAVAKMVVNGQPPSYIEQLPYDIIPKDTPTYRSSVFKERAIVRERVRLTFGMVLKEFGAQGPIHDDDVGHTLTDQKVLTRPIVNVIKSGCERCPEHSFYVTNLCRGCISHPCVSVCPKDAVSIIQTPAGPRSIIDQEKCIKCGKCAQVCPYNAIAYRERPCAAACGVNAIFSDEFGYAEINPEKCVSCGLCIVSCPFGAIAERSEIVQVIYALKGNLPVHAEIAPSFVSQFGPLVSPGKIITALKQIGFAGVHEVAYGADVTIMNEAEELRELLHEFTESKYENVPEEKKCFVGTSCCTAWHLAAHRNFPRIAEHNISASYTPMVETAKKIKSISPNSRVVFIGPCIAKKEECFDPYVAQYVDFVMTFEELAALFQAYQIDPSELQNDSQLKDASKLGREFPVAGGVANAVKTQVVSLMEDAPEIPTIAADTLADCMSMLKKIQKKRLNPPPLLVEGMACPFGCVGGPGTLAPLRKARKAAQKYAKESEWQKPTDHISQS